jgi:hypothetical protein
VILPSKHLDPGRDLLSLGALALTALDQPLTVSELWIRVRDAAHSRGIHVPYDWFTLAVCFTFSIGAVEFSSGVLKKLRKDVQ